MDRDRPGGICRRGHVLSTVVEAGRSRRGTTSGGSTSPGAGTFFYLSRYQPHRPRRSGEPGREDWKRVLARPGNEGVCSARPRHARSTHGPFLFWAKLPDKACLTEPQ